MIRWGRVVLAGLAAAACRPGAPADGSPEAPDQPTAAAAEQVMSGPLAADPHLRLTAARAPAADDSARAAAVIARLEEGVARYREVRVAEADGFREFLPGVPQDVAHYTNWRYAMGAMVRFDAARPTSLLYRRLTGGGRELVGAMYTAPAREGEAALDARLPLSLYRWHQHVNWCVPPRSTPERWRETRNGQPLFGPKSPIADADACAAVGGRFLPRIFGWMVHVEFGGHAAPHAH